MKYKIIALFTFIIVSAMTIITSCDSSTYKVQEVSEDVTGAEDKLLEAEIEYKLEIQKFKEEYQLKIDENYTFIDQLNARIHKEKKDTRAEFMAKIADLEQRNSDLRVKLNNCRIIGKENWETFKAAFKIDMIKLNDSFNELNVGNVDNV